MAPYSCEPAKKKYVIESVVFFGFPSLSNVLTANISKILKDRVFLEKMLKREYPEPNLVGMSSPTREAALSLSLKHIYHTCAPVEIYQKHLANVRKYLHISINVQKQNISYVLD